MMGFLLRFFIREEVYFIYLSINIIDFYEALVISG